MCAALQVKSSGTAYDVLVTLFYGILWHLCLHATCSGH
jgi:hypothetical protein